MLIQFTVENFLSIKDKVYLSLEPSKDTEHQENILTKGNHEAVSSIAIYGANASGKSSLFKAITAALIMIRNSNNVQITDELPVTPFKFDSESQNRPTSFEFTFIAEDDRKYIYGFSAT
ncbi:AAA family ATPase, partial [Ligilactobacillus sp.]|uniref:AAA family ATPase n=1 Tax=Ligilactobacillus sp. TaxID=2767921 RepID=UPI002FDFE961